MIKSKSIKSLLKIKRSVFKFSSGLLFVRIGLLLFFVNLQLVVQAGLIYTTNSNKITITGCSCETNNLVIPHVINNIPVMYIGYGAFFGCAEITNVIIPNSIIAIGESAFSGCNRLVSITIPDSVSNIGNNAFKGCKSLTAIKIPSRLVNLDWGTFSDCSSLTNVIVPTNVLAIKDEAFGGCSNLKSVVLHSRLSSIDSAFPRCPNLTAIEVVEVAGYNNFRSISGALYQNSVLVRCPSTKIGVVNIQGTSVRDGAFDDCREITAVHIPIYCTSIDDSFADCESIKTFEVEAGNKYFSINDGDLYYSNFGVSNKLFKIPNVREGVYRIPINVKNVGRAFSGCTKIRTIIIHSNVTSMATFKAFRNCDSLELFDVDPQNQYYRSRDGALVEQFNSSGYPVNALLKVPNSRQGTYSVPKGFNSIAGGSLADCNAINEIVFEDHPFLQQSAFENCANLKFVNFSDYLPDSVYVVNFASCANLESVWTYSKTSEGAGVEIKNGMNFKKMINVPSIVANEPVIALGNVIEPTRGWANIVESVDIPPGILRVTGAFRGFTNLRSVKLPNSLTELESAFTGCRSLNLIELPDSVLNIGESSFAYCTNLTSIAIPINVTTIGEGAFLRCSGLKNITIPNSVTNIGDSAFSACNSLQSITVAEWNLNYSSVDGVLFNKNLSILNQFPAGKTGSYTIPNSVTNIGNSAFSGCSGLTNIIFLDGAKQIWDNAFTGLTNLTNITIPNSITNIGNSAFSGCGKITNITMPASVKNIANNAFFNCSALISVHFLGDAPKVSQTAFLNVKLATVYFNPGTIGWTNTFGGRPTKMWVQPSQARSTNLGFKSGQFGFDITAMSGPQFVIEAATNLVQPVWKPLSTNTSINGTASFIDPKWEEYPTRLYRIRTP